MIEEKRVIKFQLFEGDHCRFGHCRFGVRMGLIWAFKVDHDLQSSKVSNTEVHVRLAGRQSHFLEVTQTDLIGSERGPDFLNHRSEVLIIGSNFGPDEEMNQI